MIPSVLYRGDSDKDNVRKIRSTIQNNLFLTNLTSGGSGDLIFTEKILNLVIFHVDPGWSKSHFLSFSEDEEKAKEYALHDLDNTIDYFEYDGDGNAIDYVMIELNRTLLTSITEIDHGLFRCLYKSELISSGLTSEIFLIDAYNFLQKHSNSSNSDEAKHKSQRDKEWLVLPQNPIRLNFGKIEYTGILDGGCIGRVTKYSKSHSFFGSFF